MIIELKEFELEILKMIAITNKNIKAEEEYLEELKERRNDGYWAVSDPENPFKIIPNVEVSIKCLEEQRRTYETTMSIAKRISN